MLVGLNRELNLVIRKLILLCMCIYLYFVWIFLKLDLPPYFFEKINVMRNVLKRSYNYDIYFKQNHTCHSFDKKTQFKQHTTNLLKSNNTNKKMTSVVMDVRLRALITVLQMILDFKLKITCGLRLKNIKQENQSMNICLRILKRHLKVKVKSKH
jgi:ABC-type phosphate/phosphonate transport system permease subunit